MRNRTVHGTEILNSKSEILNKFKIPMFKIQNVLNLVIVIYLELAILDLVLPCRARVRLLVDD